MFPFRVMESHYQRFLPTTNGDFDFDTIPHPHPKNTRKQRYRFKVVIINTVSTVFFFKVEKTILTIVFLFCLTVHMIGYKMELKRLYVEFRKIQKIIFTNTI